MENFKLKIIRKTFRFIKKVTDSLFRSTAISTIGYPIADFFVKIAIGNKEIFEMHGFKIKKGRTTRISILTGEFEPSTTKLIKNEVKEGMVVFDMGANIGLYSLLCSRLVGKSGYVYAFEPEPYLVDVINENIKLNQITNVKVFPYAISNKIGNAKFGINKSQDGDNRLESKIINDEIINVETITIDYFCEKYNLKPDFIKMDIQGSEPKAFEGMKNTIASNQNIKIITEFFPSAITDVGSSTEKFLDNLEKIGFTIKELPEGIKEKLTSIDKQKLIKNKNISTNLYCYFEDK